MKKASTSFKKRKQPNRAPEQPKGVTELTEQALEQVQGGQGLNADTGGYAKHIPNS